MSSSISSDTDEQKHRVEKTDRVFGPNGFGIVMSVNHDVDEALVQAIRPDEAKSQAFPLNELEVVDDDEWVFYEEGVTETPHR